MSGERSILITGCSSGIGRHAAEALARRGWRVFATARAEADRAALDAAGLTGLMLDYQRPETIAPALDAVLGATSGRLDALFNNGAFAQPGAIEDLPTDALRASFEANFFGWHELTRRVLPVMRAQGSGRIVQCSSVLGFVALRMRGAYIATKFALEGYTDTLRLELRGTGIHVVLLEPGPIRTRIRENAQAHYRRWVRPEASPWAEFYRDTLEPRLFAENPPRDPGELTCTATTAALIRALDSPRPRPRYPVTLPTHAMGALRRLLPTRALDALLIRG